VLQKGVISLPKSTNLVHIEQKIAIDFEISATDMEYLDKLTNPLKVIVIPKIKRTLKKHLYALKWNKLSE
jgi:diketogulonate reductase-like aldo/keto reductase